MSITGAYDPAATLDRRLELIAAALAEAITHDNQVLTEELEVRYDGMLAERLLLGPVP